ncbi:MAG: enoyl-CoA hydratase/isomerase family protein [Kibdelosporangium sp.]
MTDVVTRVTGRIGRITLNRPKVLNALTHDMVRVLDDTLAGWEHDDRIRVVVVDGAGERGLCAGGDIRSVYTDARRGGTASLAFWADEYRLNARIAQYPKPYVALMDGLVSGCGLGVSAHGSVRVVTERTRIGVPEVGIGLAPDAGVTYLLSRAPDRLGVHIALTGTYLSAGDAIHCGLADSYVPSGRIPQMLRALENGSKPQIAALSVAQLPPDRPVSRQAEWLAGCYAAPTVEEILARLTTRGGPGISASREILTKSPTALKVSLRALREAAKLPTLEEVLNLEYRISAACLRGPDLVEGIRAQIIDKDQKPRWTPAALADVTDEAVAGHFAGLGSQELGLEAPLPEPALWAGRGFDR